MGQGRKKGHRSNCERYRKRSISYEDEIHESSGLYYFIGPAAEMRDRFESAQRRKPTPFPGRSNTLSPSSVLTPISLNLASKSSLASSVSPTNVLEAENSVPFVPTSVYPKQASSTKHGDSYHIAELVTRILFQDNTVFQNGRHHDISESRDALRSTIEQLLKQIHNKDMLIEVVMLRDEEVLRHLFLPNMDFVLRLLVQNCRFERIYGLSINLAIITDLGHVQIKCFQLFQHLSCLIDHEPTSDTCLIHYR